MNMNQREAVFQAVTAVVGHIDGPVEPTREQRAQVNAILVEGFKSGTIELGREYSESELKAYVSGLQSNWLRKDPRLNGGVKYQAKNPGSRAGSGDPQLKALRALRSTLTDPAEIAEVDGYIATRQAELAKHNAPTIDLSALPPELAAKFTKS
jgi:hypothetical protein